VFYYLQDYYNISGDEASEALRCLTIFHPYGVVGPLPWQGQENAMEFGEIRNSSRLLRASKGIKDLHRDCRINRYG